MPRIKRWFPVSHDINSDPEVWALTDQFGDRGLRAWLEILSIADRNEGAVSTQREDLVRAFSIKLNSTQDRMRKVLEWFETHSWIVSDPIPRVRNYSDYHKVRGAKQIPHGSQVGSPPSEPSEPNLPKKSKKTSFPEDFAIGPQLRGWCLQQHVFDPEPHLEAFKDFHTAKGSRFTDWEAAFRTWIRNRERFGPKKIVTHSAAEQLRLRTAETLKRGL